jgi:hypothetical protein
MRDYKLWQVKWGRISTDYLHIAANSLEEVIGIAVEYMRNAKPNWDADKNDILEIKNMNMIVFTSGEPDAPHRSS